MGCHLAQLLKDILGNICIGIDILYVIEVFQPFQQADHLLGIFQLQ
jgi:hypothetical protein